MASLPRESKYRHIFKDNLSNESYLDINPDCFGESQHIAVNSKFWAVPITAGGGGTFMIHDLSKTMRIERNHPLVKVHKARVLELAFNPFSDNVIASSSDDCFVKICKFPDEITTNITKESASLAGHSKKVTLLGWHPTSDNVLASSGNDKTIKIWDVEEAEEAISCPELDDLIYSINWNEDGSLMGSSSQDRIIRILDPRDENPVVQKVEGHENKKISRIFWLNNHGMIGSVGFTKESLREILFFDVKNLSKPFHRHKIDRQNSKFFPYFEEGNNILFLSGKGDCGVRSFEISDQEGFCHPIIELKCTQPHKGIAVAPRRCVDTSKTEIFKAFRLLSNSVEGFSVCVPRKNSAMVFQEDLYPDCYAGKPSISIDEYFDGINKKPIKTSMNTQKSKANSPHGRYKRRGKAKPESEENPEKTPQKTEKIEKTPQKIEKAPSNLSRKEARKIRRLAAQKQNSAAKIASEKTTEKSNENISSSIKKDDKKMTKKEKIEKNEKNEKNTKNDEKSEKNSEIVKNLEKKLKMLTESNEEKDKQIESFKAKIAQFEEKLEEKAKNLEESEKTVKKLEKKIEAQSETGNAADEEEINRLKRKVKKLSRKVKSLNKELEESEDIIDKQSSNIKSLNKKLLELE